MKTVLMLLFSCVVSKADNSFYDVICDESVDSGLYFKPVSDPRCIVDCIKNYDHRSKYVPCCIPGRYALKWCTSANETVTKWTLRLRYYTSLEPEQCNKDFLFSNLVMHSYLHSNFEQPVQVNSNCKNICFSTTMDAIFSSACYHIYTKQVDSSSGVAYERTSYDHYHYVRENDTNAILTLQGLTNMTAHADYESDGEVVVLKWYPGVPASQYEVTMDRNGTTHDTKDTVYMNCSTVTPTYVVCRARAAPHVCYSALFTHTAPWQSLHDNPHLHFRHTFCHTGSPTPTHDVKPFELWWVVGFGGASLLGALALAALGAVRAARSGRFKESTRQTWVNDIARRLERPRQPRAPGRILLLYARDCAHMERAAAHLAALLQRAAGCEVVDLYSPATVSAWAPAAAPWLRAVLQRADTRVLLLQSPALALYRARLARDKDAEPALEAPLLGARAAWRRPHAADAQLLLALRLLADGAHHEPLPYKKYYVAHVSELQHEDAVPALTPQRRYELPRAAALLLRHLAPPPDPPADPAPDPPLDPAADPPLDPAADPPLDPAAQHLLRQFTEALDEFRKYATDNPDYLLRDLVLD